MKSGIDYFPLDVNMDEKVELIEAEFGLTGFAILVKLLQRIYGGEGWYVEWTNEVALLFAKRVGAGGSVVSEIVEALIKRGIFDKTLYDKYHILTSAGIQRRYFEAVSRRKNVKVKAEYLLVNVTDFLSNVDILSENVCTNKKNADILKQSKVEKSKVYNSLSPRVCAHESSPLQKFIDRWKVSANAIANYRGGKMAEIDWDKVSAKVEQSSFLQKQKAISFFVNNYEKILDGAYDDWDSPPAVDTTDPDFDISGLDKIHYD